eukprot:GHVU01039160.1.p4 GENE.GHVU01039160.1~~GHVU01039160.1.p4  ORF type:complete len:104 (-),score=3.82 GHVU01039160.1:452-763(-)
MHTNDDRIDRLPLSSLGTPPLFIRSLSHVSYTGAACPCFARIIPLQVMLGVAHALTHLGKQASGQVGRPRQTTTRTMTSISERPQQQQRYTDWMTAAPTSYVN